jgi:integration host factor subunit beta
VTKHDIIEEVVARYAPRVTRKAAERVVNAFFAGMVQALARGERVEVRGFGSFSVKHRPARERRNPRTRAVVAVPAGKTPVFKAAKGLLLRINKP